jgi:hypothetical protein
MTGPELPLKFYIIFDYKIATRYFLAFVWRTISENDLHGKEAKILVHGKEKEKHFRVQTLHQ